MASNTISVDAGSSSKLLEAVASEAILPGHLLLITSDGKFELYAGTQYHLPALIVAVENVPEGKTVSDEYSIGDKVYARHFRPGDILQVRYYLASAVAIGATVAAEGVLAAGQFTAGNSDNEAICYAIKTDAGGSVERLITVFAK